MTPLKLALVLEAVNRFSAPMKDAERALGAVRAETDRTARAAAKLQALSSSCESVGRKSLAMGAALGVGAGAVLKSFTDLENAQAAAQNAYSTLDGLDKAWDSVNKQAIKAGDLYPGTTADFINLAASMKSMGMEAATIESGAFKGAAALQVMFGLNPEAAGEQFVQMSKAMGIAGKDSLAFADTIQRAKYAGGMSLSEISDAMPYAGAALKRFGVEGLEDAKMVLATMGMLKQAGLNGSMIGTAMAGALDHLAILGPKLAHTRGAIAQEAAAAMSRNGIQLEFFDSAGGFKGYGNFLAQMDKIKNIKSDADKALIAKTFFGEEGGRMVSMVSLAGYDEMARKMVMQEDIQKRLDRITKTLGNSMEAAGGTAKNVAAKFGERMAPAIKTLLERVNTFLGSMGEWIDRHPVLSKNIGLTVLSVSALLSVVGGGSLVVGKLASGLVGFGRGALFAWRGLSGMTGGLVNAGQGIVACTRYAGSFRAGMAAWSRLQFPGIMKLGGQLGEVWRGMVRLVPVVWSNVVASWAWIKAWASSPIQTLKYLGNVAWASFAKMLPVVWANVTAAWAWTAALLANPLTWVVAGVVALAAGAYLVIKHWDKVKAWFVSLWNWFKGLLNKTPDWVLALVMPVGLVIKHWDKIKVAFTALWGWAKAYFAKAWPWLLFPLIGPVGLVIKHWDKIKTAFTALLGWIKGMGAKFKEAGLNIVKAIWEGMKGMASKPVEAIQSIVQKVRRFLPFSPAKEGPLKDIHRIKLVETIAGSLRADPLVSAMRGVMQASMIGARAALAVPVGVAALPLAAAGRDARPQVVINFTANVKIEGGAPAEMEAKFNALMEKQRDALLKQVERAMEVRDRRKLS